MNTSTAILIVLGVAVVFLVMKDNGNGGNTSMAKDAPATLNTTQKNGVKEFGDTAKGIVNDIRSIVDGIFGNSEDKETSPSSGPVSL